MEKVLKYDLKLAFLTAIVLTLGSIIIFAINSSGSINPNWEGVFYVIIPLLWIPSFIPLGIIKISKKIRGKN